MIKKICKLPWLDFIMFISGYCINLVNFCCTEALLHLSSFEWRQEIFIFIISVLFFHDRFSASGMNCFNTRRGFLTEEGRREALELVEASSTVFALNTQLTVSLPLHKYLITPKWKRLFTAEDVLLRWGWFFCFLFCFGFGCWCVCAKNCTENNRNTQKIATQCIV